MKCVFLRRRRRLPATSIRHHQRLIRPPAAHRYRFRNRPCFARVALELRAHVGNARTRRISTVSLMSSNDEICEKGSKCCDELRAFVRCTTAHLGQAPKEYETEWCTEEKHVVFISRAGGSIVFFIFFIPFQLLICVCICACMFIL